MAASPVRFLSWVSSLRLERVHSRRQSRPALPELLRPDQPERRIVGEALRIVHVLVARQPPVHRLPDQVGEGKLGVLAPRIDHVLRDQIAEAQPLVQFAYEDQPAIGGDPRDGLFVVTIRPETYWDVHSLVQNYVDIQAMKADHTRIESTKIEVYS